MDRGDPLRQGLDDLIGAVMRVDEAGSDLGDLGQGQGMGQEASARDLDQGFRTVSGERPHAGADTGGEKEEGEGHKLLSQKDFRSASAGWARLRFR